MLEKQKIVEYIESNNPIWNPILPKGIPPEDILVPYDHIFYRLVENNYIQESDFRTYTELYPTKDFRENFWLALGLSLSSNLDGVMRIKKLPNFKSRKIAQITLNPHDGVVKQTTNSQSHYTLWKTNKFNYNLSSVVVNI